MKNGVLKINDLKLYGNGVSVRGSVIEIKEGSELYQKMTLEMLIKKGRNENHPLR